MDQNEKKPDLTRQRIFLALFFGLAILLAVGTIVGTLINRDDAIPAPASIDAPAAVAK